MERAAREEVLLADSVFFSSSWPLRFDDFAMRITNSLLFFTPTVPLPSQGEGWSQGNVQKQTNLITVSIVGFMLEVVSGINDTDGAGARAHDHRLGRRAAGKKMNPLEVVAVGDSR